MAVIIFLHRMTTPTETCMPAGQVKTMLQPGKLIGFVTMKRDKMEFADISPK
jgi:hypothetical protein